MNWRNQKISEVAKEQIWKEHVRNESQYMNWKETFSINPYRLDKTKPMCDSISKRQRRFLCKDQALLASIQRQLNVSKEAGGELAAVFSDVAPEEDLLEEEKRKRKTADNIKESLLAVHKTPAQKYSAPQTESQELGWVTKPLIPRNADFHHALRSCDITRFSSTCTFSKG